MSRSSATNGDPADDRYPSSPEEAADLADALPWPTLCSWLSGLATDDDQRAIVALRHVLSKKVQGTYEKHIVPLVAARALLFRGAEGVAVMVDAIRSGSPYERYLLEALWNASHGRAPSLDAFGGQVTSPPSLAVISDATREAAMEAVDRLLADSVADARLLTSVTSLLSSVEPAHPGEARGALELLTRPAIKLTPALIEEFEDLVAADRREEDYQQFLAKHPVFLDPLAAEIVPKQKLGLEHVTDYAVRRHDDRWVLVEIEKPQDRLFTVAGDFAAPFTHAFGQVLDFQRWVEDHDYARELMPGIAAPRGLLVMGRRSELDVDHRRKLLRFATNSATIDILTFDDLAANARVLYRSLHGPAADQRPVR